MVYASGPQFKPTIYELKFSDTTNGYRKIHVTGLNKEDCLLYVYIQKELHSVEQYFVMEEFASSHVMTFNQEKFK